LDQGYRKCREFVKERIIDRHAPLNKIAHKEVNFKSNLIEWSQKHKLRITFELVEMFTDKSGSPVFQTSVSLMDTPIGVGIGYTKKESQQSAARIAIKKIHKDKEVQRLISTLKQQMAQEKENPTPQETPAEEE
jgi:ribonuclease-3